LAQNIAVSIEIKAKNISPVSSVSIRQRIDWHHDFEVKIPVDNNKSDHKKVIDKCKDFIGEKISIKFKKGSSDQNLFEGLITDISLFRNAEGDKDIILKGYSPTILIDTLPNTRSFTKKAIKDMINGALEDIPHDLKVKLDPTYSKQIPYYVQYKESNFHFMQRIAEEYGQWCYYNGIDLIYGKLQNNEEIDLPLDNNLFDFDFSFNLIPFKNKSIAYNYLENKTYQTDSTKISINDLDGIGEFARDKSKQVFKQESLDYTRFSPLTNKELDEIEERKQYSSSKNHVEVNGLSDNPQINVGSVVKISDKDRNKEDYGKYIIISVEHYCTGTGSYENNFHAIPHDAKTPLPNEHVHFPSSDFQIAVVKDNDDPEKLGRVRVQHIWQKDKEMSPWIRIVNPHGGKSKDELHGFYFIPEIDDEVLVGFVDENLNNPFVLGSLYHKKSAPSDWVKKGNNIKAIKTRQGNQILFNDEKGKEEIRILNTDAKDATNEIVLSLRDKVRLSLQLKVILKLKQEVNLN